MISTALALLAATMATSAVPTTAPPAGAGKGYGPLTATYTSARGTYCVRSGWISASFQTGRHVRAGDCGTSTDWRRRGVEFTPPATTDLRIAAR